jgi:hypothetical protein
VTRQNFERALRGFVQRRPFQPFLIEFVSGDRLTIRHPEAVRFHGEVVLYLSPDRAYRAFDSTSVCQLLDLPAGTP